MHLTGIDNKNEKAFFSLLPMGALKASDKLIRIGVLTDEKAVAGALSARIYDGFFDILSLFIMPSERRRGYGRALFETIEKTAMDHKKEALTAEFLSDEASVGFAKAMDFELFKGRQQYYFTLGELLRSPLYKRLIRDKDDRHAPFVSTLSEDDKKVLAHRVGDVFYDPAWSTACIKDGEYLSCMLADHEYDISSDGKRHDSVSVIFLNEAEGGPMDVLHHLRSFAKKAVDKFGEDSDVIFRMTFENDKITRNVFELMGRKTHLHYEGRYMRAVKLI